MNPSHNEPPARPAQPRQQQATKQAQATAPRSEPLMPEEMLARFNAYLDGLKAKRASNSSFKLTDYTNGIIRILANKSGNNEADVKGFMVYFIGHDELTVEYAAAFNALSNATKDCLNAEMEQVLIALEIN